MNLRKILPVILAAGLAAPGLSQDRDDRPNPGAETDRKPRPEAESRDRDEDASRPGPPKRGPQGDRRGAPRPGGPGGQGPVSDRPDPEKVREEMQKRMREIQELKAAGKTDEAEKKMAEVKRQMTALRSRGPGRDGNASPGKGPGDNAPRANDGPRPPSRGSRPEGAPSSQTDSSAKAAGEATARPAGPAKGDAGPDREILAMMREKAGDKMREIQKLREAGKHDEANRRMAEMRAYFEAAREKMSHGKGPEGPGPRMTQGPPWAKRDHYKGSAAKPYEWKKKAKPESPKKKDGRAKQDAKEKSKSAAAPRKKRGPKQAGKKQRGKGGSHARHEDRRKRFHQGHHQLRGPWARGARPGSALHFRAGPFAHRQMMIKRWAETWQAMGHRTWRGGHPDRDERDQHGHARRGGPGKPDHRHLSDDKGDHHAKGNSGRPPVGKKSPRKDHGRDRGSDRDSD